MVGQASVDGNMHYPQSAKNGAMHDSGSSLRQQVAGVLQDVWALASLHGQLFAADCRAAATRIMSPLVFVVASVLILAAALPICILGACLFAADWLQVSIAVVMLTVGGILCTMAVVACIVASRKLRKAFQEFDRTRAELHDNATWLKEIFEQS